MMDDGILVERSTPVGNLTTVGAALAFAVGSGVVVFLAVGAVAVAFGLGIEVPLVASGVVTVATWGVWAMRVYSLFWQSETVRQGTVPASPPQRDSVSVTVGSVDGRQYRYLDLPGNNAALRQLAAGVLNGRSFSEGEWTGNGRPYSLGEFRALRGELLERGFLVWRNEQAPSQGVQLTAVGRSVFRGLLDGTRTHAHDGNGGGRAVVRTQKGRGVQDGR